MTPASKLLVRAEEKNLVSFAMIQLHADEMLPWHYLIAGIEGETMPFEAVLNVAPLLTYRGVILSFCLH